VSFQILLNDPERTCKGAGLTAHAKEGTMNNHSGLLILYKGFCGTGGYTQRVLAVTTGRGKIGLACYIPVTDTRLAVVGLHTRGPAALATAA